jgi:hypothetical protein
MGVRKRIFTLSGAIVTGLIAIAVGLILWSITLSSASQGRAIDAQPPQSINLDHAANQADDLAEDVYNGLDTTKQIIGKTEARNQAIEQGRNSASQKLDQLADRARQAEASGDDVLSTTDKRVLKHITE